MEAEFVTITPAMAEEWLEKNKSNRNVRPATVNAYASDMKNGRWDETTPGSPIVRDTEGNLLNGQHRLYAIIKSQTPVKMFVCWGASPQAHIFDIGAKRSIRDIITLDGKFDKTMVGSREIEVGRYAFELAANWSLTTAQQLEAFFDTGDTLAMIHKADQISTKGKQHPIFKKATVAFAIYEALNYGYPEEELERFATIGNTGFYENSSQTAAVTLRNAFLQKTYISVAGKNLRRLETSATEQALIDFHNGIERKKAYTTVKETILRKHFMQNEAVTIKTLI